MKKAFIIITIIIIICLTLCTCIYIPMIPLLKTYGNNEVKRFNQLIISHCWFTQQSQYDELVIIERNDEGEIELLDFDMIKVNQIATQMVYDIENTYTSIEEGTYKASDDTYYERRMEEVSQEGIISSISLATLWHMPLFHSFLPSIKMKYKHLSSVGSSILKKVENYGVNHVMVELSIEINMNLTMVYPFFEQYQTHVIRIPILLEIFQGQVPLVYQQ